MLHHRSHRADKIVRQAAPEYPVHMMPTDEVASYYVHTPPPAEYASSERHPGLPEDIARDGVKEPLLVQSDGTWAHLEDGYHRAAEAQRQGITHLPVMIQAFDPNEQWKSYKYPEHKKLNPAGPTVQEHFKKWNITPDTTQYGTEDHQSRQKYHQMGLDSLQQYRKSQGII